MKLLSQKDNNHRLFLTDNILNQIYNNSLFLCEKIIRNKINIRWTNFLHPKNIDEQLIQIMKQSGCRSVSIGNDTASEGFLDLWQKGFSTSDIVYVTKYCNKYGASFLVYTAYFLTKGCHFFIEDGVHILRDESLF